MAIHDLSEKVIMVVGAGGLIGSEVVTGLLNAGAKVVAADCSHPALEKLKIRYADECSKGVLKLIDIDISSKVSILEALEKSIEEYGKLDGAVNTSYPKNANYGRHFFDVEFDDFSENISFHLGGYFLFIQQCAKYSLENKSKFSSVNFSSIYGVIAPRFDIYKSTTMTMPVEYAAIKSGLQQIIRYVTAYTKGSNFRANCISPGGIFDNQSEEFIKRYNENCVQKGMLNSNDVIGTVNFLCSDASLYICGQNIVVDDGFSV